MKTAALLLVLPLCLSAAIIGQIDTFEDGTTNNWFVGGGPLGQVPLFPPVNVTDGGPGGVGDAYLKITAIGSQGPGSRLVAINAVQWSGSFAGISGLHAYLKNFGTSDLEIRFLLEDPFSGPLKAAVTPGVTVPALGDWAPAFFSLNPSDLTALPGTDVNALLANVPLLRIIHAPVAGPAEPVVGVLGIDNIQAVPEPGTSALMGVATAVAVAALRRRHAKASCYTGTKSLHRTNKETPAGGRAASQPEP